MIIRAFVRLYQILLSPIFGGRCRFYPSCSEYAIQVSRTEKWYRALWLTLVRLSKCHPLGPYGVDLPPKPNENDGNVVKCCEKGPHVAKS